MQSDFPTPSTNWLNKPLTPTKIFRRALLFLFREITWKLPKLLLRLLPATQQCTHRVAFVAAAAVIQQWRCVGGIRIKASCADQATAHAPSFAPTQPTAENVFVSLFPGFQHAHEQSAIPPPFFSRLLLLRFPQGQGRYAVGRGDIALYATEDVLRIQSGNGGRRRANEMRGFIFYRFNFLRHRRHLSKRN